MRRGRAALQVLGGEGFTPEQVAAAEKQYDERLVRVVSHICRHPPAIQLAVTAMRVFGVTYTVLLPDLPACLLVFAFGRAHNRVGRSLGNQTCQEYC